MVGSAYQSHGDKERDHLPEGLRKADADTGEGDDYQPQDDNQPAAESIGQHGRRHLAQPVGEAEAGNQNARLKVIQTKAFTEDGKQRYQYTRADVMAEVGDHELRDEIFRRYFRHDDGNDYSLSRFPTASASDSFLPLI